MDHLHGTARPSIRLPVLIACLLCTGRAAAQGSAAPDYAPDSPAWNGLSELAHIARRSGTDLTTPTRVDLTELDPRDALIIVHPTTPLPVPSLTAFMRAGGRVAVADDFGSAEPLFRVFHIGRHAPRPAAPERSLRGNRDLRIAEPASGHPLTEEVRALVTNHPQVIHHDVLEPAFALGDASQDAVVLVGAVGAGRLVALADPSVLINNMLVLEGNRRFASNLVGYLTEAGPGGRLLLVTGDVDWHGSYGPGPGDPLDPLHQGFARLASLPLPPAAVRIATCVLAALGLIAAVSALPRRSPYLAHRLPRRLCHGGFLGRVTLLSEPRADLSPALWVFKFELENEILRHLALTGRFERQRVMEQLRSRGLPARDAERLERVLAHLEALDAEPRTGRRRMSRRRFVALVEEGRQALASLERVPKPHMPPASIAQAESPS